MLTKIFASFFAHYCFFYPSTPSGFPFFLTEVLKKDFCQWRTEWLVLTLKMSSLFFLLFKDSLAWNGSLGWQILILSSWKYYSVIFQHVYLLIKKSLSNCLFRRLFFLSVYSEDFLLCFVALQFSLLLSVNLLLFTFHDVLINLKSHVSSIVENFHCFYDNWVSITFPLMYFGSSHFIL